MARIPRGLIKDHDRCYHIISRTTGQEFYLGDVEKEYLLKRIKKLSSVYFTRVYNFCILSNHFHLLVQMESCENYSDEEVRQRFKRYYGPYVRFPREKMDHFRKKWSDLSEYVKEIKQGFSVWYNRRHNRRGYFWSERFKSVVVEDGAALMACMAYIDLNPVRANIVDRPEDYRYCGLGHHSRTGNRDCFLGIDCLETGSPEETPLVYYRSYVYEVGQIDRHDGRRPIPRHVYARAREKGYRVGKVRHFRNRCRYFTEGLALGSRSFVSGVYQHIQTSLKTRRARSPVPLDGMGDLYA